jgi:Xaa-Pro dipeptidase
MLTRRTLLSATAALAASRLTSAQGPSTTADSPIAALKNRRAEAVPITNEERMARVEKAQRLMQENKLNAIAVIGGTSLSYFSNVSWGNSERLFVMVLPVRGEPFFVAPAFEKDRALEQIAQGPFGKSPHVFTWEENESPYQVVASALKERGLATGRIGIEERVTFVFAQGIANAVPAATIASATEVTAGCRMIKSPAEIALMRLANSVTLQAYEAAWKSMREGMTQHEFSALVSSAYQKLRLPGIRQCARWANIRRCRMGP